MQYRVLYIRHWILMKKNHCKLSEMKLLVIKVESSIQYITEKNGRT